VQGRQGIEGTGRLSSRVAYHQGWLAFFSLQ